MTDQSKLIRHGVFLCLLVCTSHITAFDNFITADSNRLMDGKNVFRFISFNIPNLNFVEDEMLFERSHPFGLPTSFEIRDAMESVQQMGGNVIRTYTIPVRRETDTPDIPRYVLAPGVFDERAFTTMDTMLALANETGVRLIVPLLNAWKWMGGRPQYAGFRGKSEDDFWTDSQLMDDFKKTVKYVLQRTNTVTGVPYSEDKAILCWETGNELPCPHSWTRTITAYIKSLDSNHLIMDGYNAFDDRPMREASMTEPTIDIVTSHHYAQNPEDVMAHIHDNMNVVRGRKVYIIGEFGFLSTTAINEILELVRENQAISGALIWSLRYHRHLGGFYWHSEPLGYGLFKAYHWPGFDSGSEYDETNLLETMRNHAFAIQGKPVPPLPVPASPQLLQITHVASISWRGSAGASTYDIERSEAAHGPWETAGTGIQDAAVQYFPLYHDASAEIGKEYYYRVRAVNRSGKSAPSNMIGPVAVNEQAIVDNLDHLMTLYHITGPFELKTDDDRKFKEDMHRLYGEKGTELIYRTPGPITRFKVFAYTENEHSTLEFSVSQENGTFRSVDIQPVSYYSGEGDYAYWRPVLYELNKTDLSGRSLKINFRGKVQISRAEIYFGP
ncbi:hypothetical protein JW948_14165 [bacterium]|nr:hypothetical protein [bacterium]